MNEAGSLMIGGVSILPGESKDIRLKVSETYTGDDISIPVRVIRAEKPGPAVFVTAAIHGDEINGTGIIHDFLFSEPLKLLAGTLILVPVVNVLGFESNERYLPDRRDLNRSFPGYPAGSMTSRIASIFMTEIILKCDLGIDLHTAGIHRTNYPNVRGDFTNREVRRLARAFGCALMVDGKGPEGSLRREACKAGCPAIILEAGEPYKIEPSVLQIGIRGIRNVLIEYGMLAGRQFTPPYQTRVRKTTWLRAPEGGILKFHVSAGDLVEQGKALATTYGILGEEQNFLICPVDGIVLSNTTMPAVKPGEPVCHIAIPDKKLATIRKALSRASKSLHHQVKKDLATNISVVAPPA